MESQVSTARFCDRTQAGTKITHVDALSRHIGTVQQTGNLTTDEVRLEQSADQFCIREKELGITKKSSF
jgi:hypothetical protein